MRNDRKPKTTEEKVEAYFEGYRRIPDGDDPDFIAMESVGLKDLPYQDEEWPEAPRDDSPADELGP
jgi:hypothetical protein